MSSRSIADLKRFDPARLVKQNLFESERMFCDLYCLSPGQEQLPHAHEESDKLYYVVEGCGIFRIGGETREIGEGNVVHAPPGVEHSVKNDSAANLTLLVFMAPHPNYLKVRMQASGASGPRSSS